MPATMATQPTWLEVTFASLMNVYELSIWETFQVPFVKQVIAYGPYDQEILIFDPVRLGDEDDTASCGGTITPLVVRPGGIQFQRVRIVVQVFGFPQIDAVQIGGLPNPAPPAPPGFPPSPPSPPSAPPPCSATFDLAMVIDNSGSVAALQSHAT